MFQFDESVGARALVCFNAGILAVTAWLAALAIATRHDQPTFQTYSEYVLSNLRQTGWPSPAQEPVREFETTAGTTGISGSPER